MTGPRHRTDPRATADPATPGRGPVSSYFVMLGGSDSRPGGDAMAYERASRGGTVVARLSGLPHPGGAVGTETGERAHG
jgi:hypothetical protein